MSLFNLLVALILIGAALFLAAAIVPDPNLAFLETIPAKRFLSMILGIVLIVASIVVYHVVILPSPPRLAITTLFLVIPLFGGGAIAASNRPEQITFEEGIGRVPTFKIKWNNPDGWTAAIILLVVLFAAMIVLIYPELYRRKQAGEFEPRV